MLTLSNFFLSIEEVPGRQSKITGRKNVFNSGQLAFNKIFLEQSFRTKQY